MCREINRIVEQRRQAVLQRGQAQSDLISDLYSIRQQENAKLRLSLDEASGVFKRSSFQELNDSGLNDDTATQQKLRLPPISVSPE